MSRKKVNHGQRTFLKVAKQVKKEFAKQGREASWNEIQKWSSANVYPDFKGQNERKVKVLDIRESIANKLSGQSNQQQTAKKTPDSCSSVFSFPLQDFMDVDWWEAPNVVDRVDPFMQVRINAGEDGATQITKAKDQNQDEIRGIVDNIRDKVSNKSGAKFEPVNRVVPNRKADGQNCSYFIDFVLMINDRFVDSTVDEGNVQQPDIILGDEEERKKREKEAKKQAKERKKLRDAKQRKRPSSTKPSSKKSQKTTSKKGETDTKEKRLMLDRIDKMIGDFRQDVKDGLMSAKEFKKERKALLDEWKKLKDGGIV